MWRRVPSNPRPHRDATLIAALALLALPPLGLASCDDLTGPPAPAAIEANAPAAPPPVPPPAAETPPAPPPWTPPVARSAEERRENREAMVRTQIAEPTDGRQPVRDPRVLEAMRSVPRHAFVPLEHFNRAYGDTPLPIGHGQTISQPYIVAYMTALLDLPPRAKVLEIGTGSGYQAAVLAQLTPEVYTIEIIEPLAERAATALRQEGYVDVKTKRADGYFGWEEHAPFDAIIVTAAAGHVPPPLWDQLKPGGRMVIPVGGVYEVQRLLAIDKTEDGKRRSRSVMAVRFVPLTRSREK